MSVAVMRIAHKTVRKPLWWPSYSDGKGAGGDGQFFMFNLIKNWNVSIVSALQWGLLLNILAPSSVLTNFDPCSSFPRMCRLPQCCLGMQILVFPVVSWCHTEFFTLAGSTCPWHFCYPKQPLTFCHSVILHFNTYVTCITATGVQFLLPFRQK